MAHVNTQSPAVLKKPTGAANVGMSTGETVENAVAIRPLTASSIDNLKTIVGRYAGQQVVLLSYYAGWAASASGLPTGDGIFVWDDVSVDAEELGFIVEVTGVVTGRWKRILTKTLAPEMCGAVGDGSANDFAAWSSLINKVVALGGADIVCRPNAEYKVVDGSETFTSYQVLFSLGAIKKFNLDLNGSKLKCTNISSQGAFVLFGAQNGRNIDIYNGELNATPGKFNVVGGQNYGVILFQGLDRCVGVSISKFKGTGWMALVDFARTNTGAYLTYANQAQQIEIYDIEADDITYLINCRFNGSYLKGWNIRVSNVHRAYFVYGVTDHDVELLVLSWDAAAVRLWGVEGQTLQNIKVKLIATALSVPAATEAVQLVWNGTTAALLSNIKLDLDINCNSIVNTGFAFISEGVASVGRHKIDGLEVSGNIRNCVSRAVTPINRGGDYTSHDYSNCEYTALTLNNQGSNSVFPIHNTGVKTRFKKVEAVGTNPSILIDAPISTVTGSIILDDVRSPQIVGNTNAVFSAAAIYKDCFSGNTTAANVGLDNKIIINSIFGFLSSTVPVNRPDLKNVVIAPTVYSQPVVGYKLVDSPSAAASVAVTLVSGTDIYPTKLQSGNGFVRSYKLKVGCSASSHRGQIVADLALQISAGVLTAAVMSNAQAMVEAGSVLASHLSVAVVAGDLVVTMNSGGASIYDIVSVVICE